MMKNILFLLLLLPSILLNAQSDYWQQKVKYTMNVDMDVESNQYSGIQKLEYWNNSPDTLSRVFYHLYWNAFQPNSSMDLRSRRQGTLVLRKDRQGNDIPDWDSRVRDRILHLEEDEIGYQKIRTLKMNGRTQKFNYHETILEVVLDRPILPKSKVVFDMEWDAQVPLQIRRAGRDNPNTTTRYTMTQWFPKLAEYDKDGWHANEYIAREFYGVWGDFDVTINIDKNYLLGGTGYLQNPNTIGYGYEDKGAKVTRPAGNKLKWQFIAPNVHDFAWAADPDFKHIVSQVDGIKIHVLYNPANQQIFNGLSTEAKRTFNNDYGTWAKNWDAQWQQVADAAVTVYPFIKKNFGAYPYKQYSFIHAGDGGMEYAMSTMLSGPGLGTVFHEWMHSWYQMVLGFNESLYAWMDEGFTEYATNLVEEHYRQHTLANSTPTHRRVSDSTYFSRLPLNHNANYTGYFNLVRSGLEEPLTTHADHFNTNYAYSNASYSKGAVFLEQLGYIVGASLRDQILLDFYKLWKFKHPDVNDFIRLAEKHSNIKLDWYKMYWINTTKTIDYGIDSLYEQDANTRIRLKRIGEMPMPVDVKITFRDGSVEWHYVPLNLMFGSKVAEEGMGNRKSYEAWKWASPTYEIATAKRLMEISSVEIDPSHRMADTERRNNRLELRW